MKKVIATVNRPRPADFDIVEKIGKHCHFDDGVFVHNDGEGDSYFSCELPRCDNGDLIKVGSLYNTRNGIVEVISMKLEDDVRSYFKFKVLLDDDYVANMFNFDFHSIFW